MVANKYLPTVNINAGKAVSVERHFLAKYCPFIDIKIDGNGLKCIGYCKPSEESIQYSYVVKYTPGKHPSVYTLYPKIEYHEDIHMYPEDDSLCLYYPKDFSWTKTSHLYNTIIPWTHEWFLFYELYTIYGKWLHPSVAHKNNQKTKM